MTHTTMSTEKTGPLWAVFGAPLVGVPLMVGLLALGSQSAADAAVEPDLGFVVEQVDLQRMDMQEMDTAAETDAQPNN